MSVILWLLKDGLVKTLSNIIKSRQSGLAVGGPISFVPDGTPRTAATSAGIDAPTETAKLLNAPAGTTVPSYNAFGPTTGATA